MARMSPEDMKAWISGRVRNIIEVAGSISDEVRDLPGKSDVAERSFAHEGGIYVKYHVDGKLSIVYRDNGVEYSISISSKQTRNESGT